MLNIPAGLSDEERGIYKVCFTACEKQLSEGKAIPKSFPVKRKDIFIPVSENYRSTPAVSKPILRVNIRTSYLFLPRVEALSQRKM